MDGSESRDSRRIHACSIEGQELNQRDDDSGFGGQQNWERTTMIVLAFVSVVTLATAIAKARTVWELTTALGWTFSDLFSFVWNKPIRGKLYLGEELLVAYATTGVIHLIFVTATTGLALASIHRRRRKQR